MPSALGTPFVIAITAQSLFDLEWAHQILRNDGSEVYRDFQAKHEDEPLQPGVGLALTRRLLALNAPGTAAPLLEVVLVSDDDAEGGLRLLNSARHYGLSLGRAVFTGGRPLLPYLRALRVDLLLAAAVEEALATGFPAALVYPTREALDSDQTEIRLAFDSESEFFAPSAQYSTRPASSGRGAGQDETTAGSGEGRAAGFARVLAGLGQLQSELRARHHPSPVRTALVTVGDSMADQRVAQELRRWHLTLDESYFVPATEKDDLLEVFRPHVWFSRELRGSGLAVPQGALRSADAVA